MDAAELRRQLLDTGSASIEIDGELLPLESEDVEVQVEAAEHYAAAGDQQTVVVLHCELTDELRDEGLYRELLHRVQNLRKELDVEYTERIQLWISGSERVRGVLEASRDHFMSEALCKSLTTGGEVPENGERREASVDGEEVVVVLKRG